MQEPFHFADVEFWGIFDLVRPLVSQDLAVFVEEREKGDVMPEFVRHEAGEELLIRVDVDQDQNESLLESGRDLGNLREEVMEPVARTLVRSELDEHALVLETGTVVAREFS